MVVLYMVTYAIVHTLLTSLLIRAMAKNLTPDGNELSFFFNSFILFLLFLLLLFLFLFFI